MAEEKAPSAGPNIAWFGHSLLKRGSEPSIDIPAAVKGIHTEALRTGRTTRAEGVSRTFYEGPNNLDYWFNGAGDAPGKIRKDSPGWDYVVGVGFMHLVAGGWDHPGPYNFLRKMTGGSEKFKTYEAYTPVKYQAVEEIAEYSPSATWVNYVGPRTKDHPEQQSLVDQRFECIRETVESAGGKVQNVPVGRAFRNAEAAGKKRPELGLELQVDDLLHLTHAGEYLAANVFYRSLYGVDPVGLPVPPHLRGKLTEDPAQEAAVAELLQQVARDTVGAYEAGERAVCGPSAGIAEDVEGKKRLERALGKLNQPS